MATTILYPRLLSLATTVTAVALDAMAKEDNATGQTPVCDDMAVDEPQRSQPPPAQDTRVQKPVTCGNKITLWKSLFEEGLVGDSPSASRGHTAPLHWGCSDNHSNPYGFLPKEATLQEAILQEAILQEVKENLMI